MDKFILRPTNVPWRCALVRFVKIARLSDRLCYDFFFCFRPGTRSSLFQDSSIERYSRANEIFHCAFIDLVALKEIDRSPSAAFQHGVEDFLRIRKIRAVR